MTLGDLDVDLSEIRATDRLILYVLKTNKPMTQAELSHETGYTDGQVRFAVQTLKREGLIKPLPNPAEPRSFIYEATV